MTYAVWARGVMIGYVTNPTKTFKNKAAKRGWTLQKEEIA